MKFTAWEARKHIESKHKAALRKLGRFLSALIDDGDSLDIVVQKLNSASKSDEIVKWSESLAHTFVTNTLEENAKTWRQAAAMSGQGNMIRKELENELRGPIGEKVKELIDQNAQYIKSVPEGVAKDLVRHIHSKAYEGSREAEKSPDFKEMVCEMSNNHAKLISRTETSKTMSALTQARAEYTGHDWYIWHTSKDQRVRDSHKLMDGVLCRFSDPPDPEEINGEKGNGHYGPGNIFNCRCYAAPVILWKNVSWPHAVYANGQIRTMSKTEFQVEFGVVAA